MAYNDLIAFGKIFLPDFARSKTPIFHYEVADKLIEKSQKPIGLFLPRGTAKTTMVKVKLLHDFVFSQAAYKWGWQQEPIEYFYAWVSSNQKKSVNNVNFIRTHLLYNQKLQYVFGNLLDLKVDNQENIVMATGNRLISSSNMSSIRGDTQTSVLKGSLRYSGVFVDDAENEENTRTPNSREKIIDNIMNGILPAIDKHLPGARLYFLQTPLHYAAFAQQQMDKWAQVVNTPFKIWIPPSERPEPTEEMKEFSWDILCYQSTQPNLPGGVLWESYYPREKLDQIRKQYLDSPQGISGYLQEYELEVQSSENSIWTGRHIHYHEARYFYEEGRNYIIVNGEKLPVNIFGGCDPATDIDTYASDFSVIMYVAVTEENDVYVLQYVRKRSIPVLGRRNKKNELDGPEGVVDTIMRLHQFYHAEVTNVEDVAMNRSIFQSLNDVRRRENLYDKVRVRPVPPGGQNKHTRIHSLLESRFAMGLIHIRNDMFDLENEIKRFGPRMAHDDTIETLYYALVDARPPKKDTDRHIVEPFLRQKRKKKSWLLL